MHRIKMVLLLVLLLGAVVTTAATFVTENGSVVKAECPQPGEMIGTCETNERDPNFGSCKPIIGGSQGQTGGHYISVCYENDCSYTDPNGSTISGRCCYGGSCYKEE